MSDGDARSFGLVQAINPEKEAVKLIESEKAEDIVIVLNFDSQERAQAFASCMKKCDKYGLKKRKDAFIYEAKCMAAINGAQAKLFSQTVIQVPVPGFYDKNSSDAKVKRNGQHENT